VDLRLGVTPDRTMSLSRIEAEAQKLLQERLHSLQHPSAAAADPAASWRDWESTPPQRGEEARRELAEVEDALRRIADGRYGTCLACGGPLGLQRIRAIPEARYCLSCSGARLDD
jgi:DnaK suppressor protein